jgi:LysM repeat protein
MRSFCILLPLLGLAMLTTSCKSTKTASTNAYQNNPYYSASGNTTNYSSTPSTSSYPSYTENAYTPPTSVPNVPSVPTYNQPAYSGPAAPSTPSAPPVSYSGSGSKSHTVASGENLYRISQKNGTTVAAIKSANGLTSDVIRPGQSLVIP